MSKKLIVFLGFFIGLLMFAEYFILGSAIFGNKNTKVQSKEEFCKSYPRHRGCFKAG